VNAVLNALEADLLISDTRYAEIYVRQRADKGYGPVRIAQELREKGIEASIAQAAIEVADTDWLERARRARVKRFGRPLPTTVADKARQMRFLEYRGFAAAEIRGVMRATDNE